MVSCVFSFYLWYSYVFSIINNTLSFNVNYKRDINNVFIIILPLNSFKNKPCRFIKMRERRSWIGLESMSQHSNRFLIKIPNTPSKWNTTLWLNFTISNSINNGKFNYSNFKTLKLVWINNQIIYILLNWYGLACYFVLIL